MFNEFLRLLLVGWLYASLLMLLFWVIHLLIRDAGMADVGWAGSLVLMCGIYYFLGSGYGLRKMLIALMVAIWGLRLSFFLLFTRVIGHKEDARYQRLRKEWGEKADFNFFFFFQLQSALNLIFSLPFLLSSMNPTAEIGLCEWAGMILWLMALIGETLADYELREFKLNPENKGKTCRWGLWKYSRHPNYFFEWLIWCAYFLFALSSPYGFVTVLCPLLLLYFLFKVTGIPATEAQALKTKGDDYRNYQRTTSVFVPWLQKK